MSGALILEGVVEAAKPPVQSAREQILDVLGSQRQEQLVEVPRIVFQERNRQRTCEQLVDFLEVVEELVFKVFSQGQANF